VPEQLLSATTGAAVSATLLSESRGRAWRALSIVVALTGTAVLATPIPFWDPAITTCAVIALDLAWIAISLSIVASYDSVGWLLAQPMSIPGAVSVAAGARIAAALAAVATGILLQTVVALLVMDAQAAGRFAVSSLVWAAVGAVLVAPWSVLARAIAGPVAAPWIVLAAVVIGAAPAGESRVLAVARLLLPAAPTAARLTQAPVAADWLYALAHAAAVIAVTSLIRRRYR
jgi:hypothetical protein